MVLNVMFEDHVTLWEHFNREQKGAEDGTTQVKTSPKTKKIIILFDKNELNRPETVKMKVSVHLTKWIPVTVEHTAVGASGQ